MAWVDWASVWDQDDFPELSAHLIDTANGKFIPDYNEVRHYDFQRAENQWWAEARIFLELRKRGSPGQAVHWPDEHPVIGFVPG